MKLTLPEPPSANRYWRTARGRVYRSKEAVEYKATVADMRPQLLVSEERWILSCPIAVTLKWYRSRRSGDLDNRIKILLDVLQGVAYKSDSQIEEIHAYRYDDKKNPRIEITITPILEGSK